MTGKRRSDKVKKEEERDELEPPTLRRSSRSTRGSVKPVVDLTKTEVNSDNETTEESTKSKKQKKVKKTAKDQDIVEILETSDNERNEDEEDANDEFKSDENSSEDDNDDDDKDDDFEEPKSRRSKKQTVARTSKSKTNLDGPNATKKSDKIAKVNKSSGKTKQTNRSSPGNKSLPSAKNDKKKVEEPHEEIETYYELNEKELKDINKAFDVNCSSDETLNSDQLKTSLRSMGFEPRFDEILKLMDKFCSKNKLINRDGFHKIMAFKLGSTPSTNEKASSDEISKVFNLLDLQRTGKITMENLRSISKELNEDITDEELHEMIAEADIDGDFMINKEEFYNIMKKTSLY